MKSVPAQTQTRAKSLILPIGDLPGKILSDHIDMQEAIAANGEPNGFVHGDMPAGDHPKSRQILLELLEEGIDEPDIRCRIMHTATNTLMGYPEWIVINTAPEAAEGLVRKAEALWAYTEEKRKLFGQPVLHEGTLFHLVPTEFERLRRLGDIFSSFAATQIIMAQHDRTPFWVQIVYADENYCFPWEPGADPLQYQPVAGRIPHFGSSPSLPF